MLDKVSLNQKIQNFIAANPSVQGMNQTQLISCLIENGIVTLTELQELSIFASDQDYEAVGLTLQNTKTINDVIQQGKDSDILFKSNDGKTYNLNQTIQNKINKLNKDLEKAEDSNGWIGKAWSWTKNVTGIGDSSNKVRDKQAHEQELLKQFTMDNPKKAEIFKELTGVDFTPEALEAFIKGELPLESEKALEGYKEGQEMATDITADILSGIGAFCIYTAAVAAAPFTGGASIAVGIAAAAASGAVIKSGIKALDCVGNNKEYTFKDLSYDLGTGAVSGLLAPVSAGAGGAIGKTVATKCGMQVLKSASKGVTEEVVTTGFKQTLQHSMLNPGSYKYVGGNLLQKTGVYGAEIAIDAGGSGALDGAFRAGINGDDVIDGAVTGFGAGVFMGGAFKGIGGGFGKWFGGKEPKGSNNLAEQFDNLLTTRQGFLTKLKNTGNSYEISQLPDGRQVVKYHNNLFGAGKPQYCILDAQGNLLEHFGAISKNEIRTKINSFDSLDFQYVSSNSFKKGNTLNSGTNPVILFEAIAEKIKSLRLTKLINSDFDNKVNILIDTAKRCGMDEQELSTLLESGVYKNFEDLTDNIIAADAFIASENAFSVFNLTTSEKLKLYNIIAGIDENNFYGKEIDDIIGDILCDKHFEFSAEIENLLKNNIKKYKEKIDYIATHPIRYATEGIEEFPIINGSQQRVVLFNNGGIKTKRPLSNRFISELDESNLITTDLLKIIREDVTLTSKLDEPIEKSLKGRDINGNSFSFQYCNSEGNSITWRELIDKALDGNNYNNLTSRETHLLTDFITNLSKNDDFFTNLLKKILH